MKIYILIPHNAHINPTDGAITYEELIVYVQKSHFLLNSLTLTD